MNDQCDTSPIPAVLDDLRAGKMIVLVDDEQRENEGDIVLPAQHITSDAVNFMLREARGMMCVALDGSVCQRLNLGPLAAVNTSQRSTAYTVTVDAAQRFGVTTGVSAADRAATIRVLGDPQSRPEDLDRPGHTQPLRARDGGTLVRAGQTEGSVDLCKLAGLEPAAVIIEIMKADGTMARRGDLEQFCTQHDLRLCSVADVIEYRISRDMLVQRIAEMPFDTEAGRFHLIAYRSQVDALPHVALTLGDVGTLNDNGSPREIDQPVLVRMHSQNLLGDVFGDVTQPSQKSLRSAMHMIQQVGRGAIVYLRHEGMGQGLLKALQTASDTPGRGVDAEGEHRVRVGQSQSEPGIRPPADKRDYGIGSQILRDLGIRNMRLITNHPFTPTALSGFGLTIDGFVPVGGADEPT